MRVLLAKLGKQAIACDETKPPELWAFPVKDYTLLFVWCKDSNVGVVGWW